MGIPDYLTCLQKTCKQVKNPQLKPDMEQQTGSKLWQGCILLPCLFNLHAKYIMRNDGLDEAQAGIKIATRISITSDMQMTPPLWQKMKMN